MLLAKLIKAEGAANDYHDKVATGYTAVNRKTNDKYPDKLTKVILQKGQYANLKRIKLTDKDIGYKDIAKGILNRSIKDPTNGAVSFHKVGKKPKWTKGMKRVYKTNYHVYYK